MNFFSYLRKKRCGFSMDEKPRRMTYREHWYSKYRFPLPKRGGSNATAQDWASGSLAEHDERFHPNGYHPEEGERCSLRATLKKLESEDLHQAEKSQEKSKYGVTPAMDVRYSELFEEYERCEAKGDKQGMIASMKELRAMFDSVAHMAFKNSLVKDSDDDTMPKVVYHGTEHGGFTEFDTDGKDKTKDTGAWFTDKRDSAFSYSGSREDMELPRPISVKYLLDEGLLKKEYGIYDKDGKIVERAGAYPTKEEIEGGWDLEDGESIGEVWTLEDYYGNQSLHPNKGTALEEANEDPSYYRGEDDLKQECIYTCFLNIEDAEQLDADGENWDNITREWMVYGPDGELIDGAYSREEADDLVERAMGDGEKKEDYTIEAVKESTDELVRDARLSGVGYDGFILTNVEDSGGRGGGYYGTVTDYIVFKPSNIKLTDVITFDDAGNVIPLSRRFDFSNPDIRY